MRATQTAGSATPRDRRITIEMDPSDGPIAGQLTVGAGHRRAFRGWLQLAHLIEDAYVSDRRATGAPAEPGRLPAPGAGAG